MDLSNVSFIIKKDGFFVDVDRGYLSYGRLGGDYAVERLAHFLDWDEVKSVPWVRNWCGEFLDQLISDPLFSRPDLV